MAELLQLSHQDILTLAPERIVARGWSYFVEERVQSPVFIGDVIAAMIIGRERDYCTRIEQYGGAIAATCDCPYDGPVCKHSIALLFCWTHRRNEFHDLREALDALSRLGAEPMYDLLKALAARNWGAMTDAVRIAGMGDLFPRFGASGALAGLIHRELECGPVPFDRVDSLATRIDEGLAMLMEDLGRHSPSAARALRQLAESCVALAPHVDDPGGVYVETLQRAVLTLTEVIDWCPAEEDEGIRLFELLWGIAARPPEGPDAMNGLANMALDGLKRCARRGLFSPEPASPAAGDGPGTIGACKAVLEGILEMGTGGLADFRMRLNALTAIAVRAGRSEAWRRNLGSLAGQYWRDARIQGALTEAAASLETVETKPGESRSVSHHRRGSETN